MTVDKISESTLNNPVEGVSGNEKEPKFDIEHVKEHADHNPADKIHHIEHVAHLNRHIKTIYEKSKPFCL